MIIIAPAVTSLQLSTARFPVIAWRNALAISNISATSADPNYPASNLANPATRPQWKSLVTSTQYLTFTQGAGGASIDSIALAAHNFGTVHATVSVETCSNTGASPQTWTPITGASLAPADDAPIIFRFLPSAYQGVRVKIENAMSAPQCGVMYAGALLVLERSVRVDVDHVAIPFGRKSKVISGMSENGNFLGRIVQQEVFEGQADFSYFTNDWYRTNFKPFLDASNEVPFFFAWSPVQHPEDVGYVWLTEDMRPPSDTVTDRFFTTMKYQGLVA